LIGYRIDSNLMVDNFESLASLLEIIRDENSLKDYCVMMLTAIEIHSGHPELYLPFLEKVERLRIDKNFEDLQP